MSSQLFINPYNFVPFGTTIEQKRKSREAAYRSEERQLISGYLTVDLYTRTPLIIPDGAHPKYWDVKKNKEIRNPEEKEKKELHKEYRFLRVPCPQNEQKEQPIIPGSELRGMLRSAYEAVTDSCVAFLLNDKPISQRVPTFGALRRRGLLAYEKVSEDSEERRWKLYSTIAECVEAAVDVREGVTKGLKSLNGQPVKEKNGSHIEGKGWLQYNIPVNTRDPYHIAYLQEDQEVYTWDFTKDDGTPDEKKNEEPYRFLKTALDRQNKSESEKKKNKNEAPNKNIADALESAKRGCENKVPVYYFAVKRGEEVLVYLSNSSIGRIAQRRKWREILDVHAPCSSTDRLCPACLLFGTIQDKGMKGHIRITDAVPMEELKPEVHTLQILGEPKPSAFEFYLNKPQKKATYWNFDFYGEKKIIYGRNECTEYYDLKKATPRGRKMYWHSPVATDDQKNRMNATMEAMNGSFRFRIYFDEISEEQLQDLIWVITLGENKENSTKQHKLGHARPLGYGSVKLTVEEKVIRRVSMQEDSLEVKLERTEKEKIRTVPGKELEKELVKNLLVLCDTKSVPGNIPVTYPRALDSDFIYAWFANNRKNSKWLKTLPQPTDAVISLEKNGKPPRQAPSGGWSAAQERQGKKTQGEVKNTSQQQNERIYLAKIISQGRPAKNEKYLEYDVEILNDEQFRRKPCRMTAHKSKRLSVGNEVEATLFRGNTFNMKTQRRSM